MLRAPRTVVLAVILALVTLVAACGDDDSGDDESATGGPDESAETTEPVVDDEPADDPAPPDSVDPDGSGNSVPSVPADEGIDDPPVVIADLEAAQVAPDPATGEATARFEAVIETPGELCAALDTSLADLTGVHVHIGAAGETGDTLIDLTDVLQPTEVPTTRSGCVPVDETTAAALENSTDALYVDVHTAAAPDGAARAQLQAATLFDLDLPR